MLFDPHRLLLIAGPCSLENRELSMEVAHALLQMREEFPEVNLVFKGSFDKANRTSLKSERGPGLAAGLEILAEVKSKTGFATLTDVHLPEQVERVAAVCDVLQIPAFLCRQTDLLVEAARSGRVVNVKKGQFLSPYEMEFVVDKLTQAGAREIWLTDRGNTFGYQNLVVDMRSIPIMQRMGTHPVLLDATHCVQLPGAAGGKSGGQREFVPVLANAALAAGANGLFVETHPRPEQALSDADSQLRLSDLPRLLKHWVKLWQLGRDG
ncbi:MAG: 3-deoxy-8-phosphooctulonate synthase [Opitutales bacterium]|nr:3-deoxy-8-phosphooctulonate synthase [Opitutales bacterium]